MTTPRSAQAPGYGWLFGMSTWILPVLFGPGFAWLGFLVVGAVSRRVAAIVAGIVISIVAVTLGVELWGGFGDLVNSIVHLGGILFALALNPGWLRTMWERRSVGQNLLTGAGAGGVASAPAAPAKRQPPRSSRRGKRNQRAKDAAAKAAAAQRATAPAKSDAARLAADLGADSSDLLATREPAEPVDVQTATADELRELPGMDRTKARRLVKERTKRGGFSSLEDFGEVAGLQPHEIVRLRAAATCSPRPRSARSFGRRVDL
ncbi:ComEA family DNA-binding protein [Microbacterium dauci]|uniref:Helix-hairpin-helix domain-containing protein n=1 Tax=Microbacterium dauci TaxID=3048008 RepID=A0ABT6ZCX2_9MICO|nr:helix-hairpin-helix domain-containing protein [Microbacterium sp. LX3-4]MDJ1114010.1 helix-hairpin-helix domain-containing protein [Microbacterium sp. LX3-4]